MIIIIIIQQMLVRIRIRITNNNLINLHILNILNYLSHELYKTLLVYHKLIFSSLTSPLHNLNVTFKVSPEYI